MTITRVGAVLSATLLLGCSGTIAASAASPSPLPGLSPHQVAEILSVNPGLSEAQLLADAQRYANRSGESVERVLIEVAATAHGVAAARPHTRGGGGGSTPVPPGRNDGDIYFVPSGFTHVGLYSGNTLKVIEAPGLGQGPSHEIFASEKRLDRGARRLTTVRSADEQEAVVGYAREHLLGRRYNLDFLWNTYPLAEDDPVNCSQLVWNAYLHAADLDLDHDGGPGVYPVDIYRSGFTTEY